MTTPHRNRRRAGRAALALAALAALAAIPEGRARLPAGAGEVPFVWDRDEVWRGLEKRFVAARETGCGALRGEIDDSLGAIESQLTDLWERPPEPDDARLAELEVRLFAAAPLLGACTERVGDFVALLTGMRAVVKDASLSWALGSRPARERLYRLLYGGRAAIEEVLLQLPRERMPTLVLATAEPSATPWAEHFGVRVHSGDILLSRGGAPTSALIARGNDYPGNFSHVALLHIDEASRRPTIIEAHIEEGVVLSSLDDYLNDTKLRVMVLRPRADLTALAADPSLPHRAATRALAEAGRRHIAYDFAMDHEDPTTQFCSEVASASYGALGIELWRGLTSMSSRGVTSWLAALGVRHFETHGPSDLEYDPQLRVVAEWRDPETLWQDHVDNAVIDALLEGAEAGDEMGYSWHMLPFARVAKAYSAGLNLLGRTGPVPEGMTATVALRVRWLLERHAAVKERTLELAGEFSERQEFTAPYWELVELARRSKSEIDAD